MTADAFRVYRRHLKPDGVLAVADFVCPSVDEEGVAQTIEALLGGPGTT